MPAPVHVVPVFPLPNVVVFPSSKVPLHFFEPRYRAMIEDMLTSQKPALAMVNLRSEPQAPGTTPAIHVVGCVGKVDEVVRNPDGTYDMVFEALIRVELREIDSGKPYRLAEIHPREDERESEVSASMLRALADCVLSTVTREEVAHDRFDLNASAGTLTDTIADRFIRHPDVRQSLLDTFDVVERVRRLVSLFANHLAEDQTRVSKSGGVN